MPPQTPCDPYNTSVTLCNVQAYRSLWPGRHREGCQAAATTAERSTEQAGRDQPHTQRLRLCQEEVEHWELRPSASTGGGRVPSVSAQQDQDLPHHPARGHQEAGWRGVQGKPVFLSISW